ncbi:hypothetical protein F8388_022673 [Cannabis sativa]|uniref:rRNA methyltransferase n=1 Tax=Cannabis sativa TaxID=3483 RepID=A0A7J6G297_CANSA|nr:hypothetical protein F8388_022673 [Cannabis sativa]
MGIENQRRKDDDHCRLARERSFRSRAAWKLIELDDKYGLFHKTGAVLDLCAAPGSWMQVATLRVPRGSLVVGVDLNWVNPIPGAIFIKQDITKPQCKSEIKRVMRKYEFSAFDLVLHDGAPKMGGAWNMEATVQNGLVIDALKLVTHFLARNGTFVTKVFRSQDYNSVKYCLSKLFERVVVHKPKSSRFSSAEIFIVAFKYKAAAKIDPRILDVRHLFKGAIEPQKKKVVHDLGRVKKKRHRDGYEDGDTTLRKVKILCDDLGVLGKQDFKHLLKWRILIRKALIVSEKTEVTTTTTVTNVENEDEDDDKVVKEMEELTHVLERKKKREKARKATSMPMDGVDDSYVDHELFSLSTIKGKSALKTVYSTELDDDYDTHGDMGDSENEESRNGSEQDDLSRDLDFDEERKRYDEQIEDLLEQAYEQYVSKKKQQNKPSKRLCSHDSVDSDDGIIPSEYDSDGDQEMNPLLAVLDLGKSLTQEEITKKWFSQDIFSEAVDDEGEGNVGKFDSEDEMQEKIVVQVKKAQKKTKNNDFEIVPIAPTTVFDSDDDNDDVDAKAEILSCGKNMLKKKQRDVILDDAYKYMMFGDEENLPKWFLDEEKRHSQPIKPVTKEEVNALKAQFKEIDARPAKKVAEAKARKKHVAMKKLEKVHKMANAILEQTEISNISKNRMIGKLYKKAIPKKPTKEYVVAKKGVQVKVGKGKTLVDRRMKKDIRAVKARKSKMAKGTAQKKAKGFRF